MRLALFLILLAVPLVELALLIKLGQAIGFWPTVLIVIGTAMAGASILHRQGFQTLQRAAEMSRTGRPPLEPAIDGVFLLLAGVLLLTPGLLTDIAGLALLVPVIRRSVARWGFKRLMRVATVQMNTSRSGRGRETDAEPESSEPRWPGHRPRDDDGAGPVIEGDFTRVDERDRPRKS